MVDLFGRNIDYARISITDRCNYRCIYCMPEEGVNFIPYEEILRFEEIVRIIKILKELGIKKVRLTGGEPLVRKNVVELIRRITEIKLDDVSLTTNGSLLKIYAEDLFKSGLRRLNISLDTLNCERFTSITRKGTLIDVLEGIEKAISVGFNPVKLNVVVMKGINDQDDLIALANLTREREIHVRFIEIMPIGDNDQNDEFISCEEIMENISKFFKLESTKGPFGNGPAEYYKLENSKGTIGFISPLSKHFCAKCNRIRITSDGMIRLCLFSDVEYNLKEKLRSNLTDEEIKKFILETLFYKPKGHPYIQKAREIYHRNMSAIGG
ncbi:MAG: GTP 3',8-cyclase MoaA [Thermodesulfobium narugense]|nr:MAG: GTP 3',8-cyclase MoaA [Thermodesulfobium narugense]